MAINQKQVLSLQQKLSPQQIQMIKLLELPTVQLEQRIKQEIEDNIVHSAIIQSFKLLIQPTGKRLEVLMFRLCPLHL